MATLVAIPATAEAKPISKVRTQVKQADRSVDRVVSLANRDRDYAAARELRKVRRSMRRAQRQVRRLGRATGTPARARRYGRSVRMVGSVANECTDELSAIVGDVGGDPQVAIAKAVRACIVIRERVIEQLTALLDQVPPQARPYIARVIALLSSDGQDEAAQIAGVLGDVSLPTDVAAILTQALELATGAISDAIGRLDGILGILPGPAGSIVGSALALVTEQLQFVTKLVSDLLTGLFGGAPPTAGGGGPGSGSGGIGGLGLGGLPGLGVLQGMFGNGFPFSLIPIDLPFNVSGFGFAVR
ncbi:MAG: hypothetical protein ACR2GL_08550 [Thermoleophilaceae bacterium]